MKTRLFVNHYQANYADRQAELDQSLLRNVQNPDIDEIIVLCVPDHPYRNSARFEKIRWTFSVDRPLFSTFVREVNRLTSFDDINIIANSDIYFDDTLARVKHISWENVALALTRWETSPDRPPQRIQGENSQDTWIFQGPLRPIGNCDFPMGIRGCDNRFAWLLAQGGYQVVNPCHDIRSYHIHRSNVRNWGDGVPGPYLDVWPNRIDDLRSVEEPISRVGRGIISFSLFGDEPRYLAGAIANLNLAKLIYPGWDCRFYFDESVPLHVIDDLKAFGADLVHMPRATGWEGCFWRFSVAGDMSYQRWIIRDTNARITYRERRAVDEWIESGAPLHIMRDHPDHPPISPGMIGGVSGGISGFMEKLNEWTGKKAFRSDERFLLQSILPLVERRCIQHVSFGAKYGDLVKPFPTSYEDFRFVGERIDHNEQCDPAQRAILIEECCRSFRDSGRSVKVLTSHVIFKRSESK